MNGKSRLAAASPSESPTARIAQAGDSGLTLARTPSEYYEQLSLDEELDDGRTWDEWFSTLMPTELEERRAA